MRKMIAAVVLALTLAFTSVPTVVHAQEQRLEVYWQVDFYVWLLFGNFHLDSWVEVTDGNNPPRCDAGYPYWCHIYAFKYCTYLYFEDGSVEGQCAYL